MTPKPDLTNPASNTTPPPLNQILNETDLLTMGYYYYDDLSLQDIGDLLQVTKVSIKERLDKCLRILEQHGYPRPKRTPNPKLKRKINMDESTMDALIQNELKPLIIDKLESRYQ